MPSPGRDSRSCRPAGLRSSGIPVSRTQAVVGAVAHTGARSSATVVRYKQRRRTGRGPGGRGVVRQQDTAACRVLSVSTADAVTGTH
jgi:phosphate/sulfate permease